MGKKTAVKEVKHLYKKHEKVVAPLEKFFVIVPETIQYGPKFDLEYGRASAGYLMAQAVHVARKIENFQCAYDVQHGTYSGHTPGKYKEVTTIVLSVRNSKELEHVWIDVKENWVGTDFFIEEFEDTSIEKYGKHKVRTAIMFGPVPSEDVAHLIGHLSLYE